MKEILDNVSPFDLPQKSGKIMASAMNAGIITGLVMIAYTLIVNIAGLQYEQWVQWLGLVPMVGVASFFAIQFRQTIPPTGYLTFGQGFKYLFFSMMICTILAIIFYFIYVSFINTDYLMGLLEFTEDKLKEKNLKPEQIKASMEMTKKFMTPISSSLIGLIANSILSVISSLIVGAIIRKEPK